MMDVARAEQVVAKVLDADARERPPAVTQEDWNQLYVQLQGTILALRKDNQFLLQLLKERDDCIRALFQENDRESADAVPAESEHGGEPGGGRGTNGRDAPAAPDQGVGSSAKASSKGKGATPGP